MFNKMSVQKVGIWKEIYAVFVAYQICITYGITLGYTSYLIPQLKEKDYGFDIDNKSAQLIGISSILLGPIGALLNIFVSDKCGRMFTLRLAFLLLIFSWISITQSYDTNMLIITRLLNGLIVGTMMCALTYISEMPTGRIINNSVYLSLFPACVEFGCGLISFVMYFVDWKTTGWILAGYSLLTLCCLLTLPESPYWYVMRDRKEDAERSLKWNGGISLSEYLNTMNASSSAADANFTLKHVFLVNRGDDDDDGSMRRNFFIFFLLTALQFSCGYFVINNYSVEFFSNVQTIADSKLLSIAYNATCFVSSLSLCFLVSNKVNVRNLMLYCSLGMFVSALSIGVCRVIIINRYNELSTLSDDYTSQITMLISFFVYTVLQYSGNGEALTILSVKIFPTALLSTLYGISEVISLILDIVASYFAPIVIYSRSFTCLFISFAISSVLTFCLTWRLPNN